MIVGAVTTWPSVPQTLHGGKPGDGGIGVAANGAAVIVI